MDISRRNILLGGVAFLAACRSDYSATPPPPSPPPSPPPPPPPPPPSPPPVTRVPFSFADGFDGFTADIADHAPRDVAGPQGMRFVAEHRRLPAPLNNRLGLLLGGTNHSSDLFMFIWREVSGLAPNRLYRVDVDVTIATDVGRGCVGLGSSPGSGVVIKAGASPAKPATTLRDDRYFVNFEKDKNPLPVGGDEVVTIGNFENSTGICSGGAYELKTLSSSNSRSGMVKSDSSGRLWIVIGTDSGSMGRTEIYYLEGAATFTQS